MGRPACFVARCRKIKTAGGGASDGTGHGAKNDFPFPIGRLLPKTEKTLAAIISTLGLGLGMFHQVVVTSRLYIPLLAVETAVVVRVVCMRTLNKLLYSSTATAAVFD